MKPFGPWSDDSDLFLAAVWLVFGSALAYGAIGLFHG